jgi:hypothetical protein
MHVAGAAEQLPGARAEGLGQYMLRADTPAQCGGQRLGLLEDLLEHEVAVLALLRRFRALRHVVDLALALVAVGAEQVHGLAADFCDIAFFHIDEALRHRQQSGDVAGDEVLAKAKADHQRAGDARHHEAVRRLRVEHDDGVSAGAAAHRLAHGLGQAHAMLEVVMHQVGDDFGIGFGLEDIALGLQFGLERLVVFDDAVVDDGDATAGYMGVGIGLGYAAVSGPARMGDAKLAGQGLRVKFGFELRHFAHRAAQADAAAVQHGDAGGVVAAVFKPAQALQQNGGDVALRDGADDSAHKSVSGELWLAIAQLNCG